MIVAEIARAKSLPNTLVATRGWLFRNLQNLGLLGIGIAVSTLATGIG